MIRVAGIVVAIAFGVALSTSAQAVGWGEFLRGQWNSACKRVGIARFQQTGYTFSDFVGPEFRVVTYAEGEYLDSACSRPIFYFQMLGILGLRSISGGTVLEPVLKGTRIRWQVAELIRYPIAFYDRRKLSEMNEKAYCGKRDWILNQAVNLLDTSCSEEIKKYYSQPGFTLEVVDANQLKIVEPTGAAEWLNRTTYRPSR